MLVDKVLLSSFLKFLHGLYFFIIELELLLVLVFLSDLKFLLVINVESFEKANVQFSKVMAQILLQTFVNCPKCKYARKGVLCTQIFK